ncbi:Alpha-ketoglutarate-dependent dioxygenase abh1 [Cytospora mali]|uniref:mRNA N(6)-methyladenine demethylase n=1 Tax=Cytospora mali TaxID=578113 RepID=A0A194W162_CYTMA|nr:Alpha-ketoglutarate-dependent dioxygenase abh1 [Valsa mali]
MTVDLTTLDAHEQPSDHLRAIWKGYAKTDNAALLSSDSIDDLSVPEKLAEFRKAGSIPADKIRTAFSHLARDDDPAILQVEEDADILHHPLLPGLLIVPSLIPPSIQKPLLSRLIHRDLSRPHHQTNLHLHHDLPYPEKDAVTNEPQSFFTYPPDSDIMFIPRDPSVHKPLCMKQVMERRLHWVTLGGQYDWTNRVYPGDEPPTFPEDVAGLLETLFPETLAQAAIVNFYTPGDTMMMHRDVSEETDKGLVSVSMGCDALFMIAPNDVGEKHYLLLRIRSGDVIYMTGESRYAWHGVPKVVKGTCPDYLQDWPAEDGKYEEWRGWMANKRINLNVRQMRD